MAEADAKLKDFTLGKIKELAAGDKPFFLEHAFMKVHADNFPAKAFEGKSASKYPYRDSMLEVDAYIGEIVQALEVQRVTVSAFGLREGLLLESMREDVRALDPLVSGCKTLKGVVPDKITVDGKPKFAYRYLHRDHNSAVSPNHPFIKFCIDNLPNYVNSFYYFGKHLYVMNSTGPVFLTKMVDKYGEKNIKNIYILANDEFAGDCTVCNEDTCQGGTYFSHTIGQSWNSWDSLFYNFMLCNYKKIIVVLLLLIAVYYIFFKRKKLVKFKTYLKNT
jgi:hypothetical protein